MIRLDYCNTLSAYCIPPYIYPYMNTTIHTDLRFCAGQPRIFSRAVNLAWAGAAFGHPPQTPNCCRALRDGAAAGGAPGPAAARDSSCSSGRRVPHGASAAEHGLHRKQIQRAARWQRRRLLRALRRGVAAADSRVHTNNA